MPKLKMLNKETITFVLQETFDMPPQLVAEIVECVWDSDEHLEAIQQYADRLRGRVLNGGSV